MKKVQKEDPDLFEEAVDEDNQKIDEYNQEVDEYNRKIDESNQITFQKQDTCKIFTFLEYFKIEPEK